MKHRLMVVGGLLGVVALLAPQLLADIPAYKSWLAAVVGGANVVYTNDNVGIGTTSPTTPLDVVGTVQMMGFKMPTGAGSGLVLTSDTSGVGTWQAPVPGGGIGGSGTLNFIPRFTSAVTIGDSAIFQSPSVPLLGSNIGIGTIFPANKLSVAGNADVNKLGIGMAAPLVNQLEVNGKAAIGTTYAGIAAPTDGLIVEGRVGIGLQTPTARLHIEETGFGGLNVFEVDDVPSDTSPFVIRPDGKVGIGVAFPSNKLDIKGEAVIGTGYAGIGITAPADGLLVEGDVGIGTQTPTERLDLGSGNIKMGYEIVSAIGGAGAIVNVTCPAGLNPPASQKRVIGGGCSTTDGVLWSFPASDTTWRCVGAPTPGPSLVTAYAICANIR